MRTSGTLPRSDEFFGQLATFLTREDASEYCVAALDVEHFKLLNEWYGWDFGDLILSTLENRIQAYVTEIGTIAGYLGNDDFMLVIPDSEEAITRVRTNAQTIVTTEDRKIRFTLKLGICPILEEFAITPYDLCNFAEIAASLQIGDGAKAARFSHEELEKSKSVASRLAEIERGIKNDEFIPYFQPKCNSLTHSIIGLEALVRWEHPERGIVTPNYYIPLLEQTGMIVELDTKIWDKVAHILSNWQKAGRNVVPVSINVSMADIEAMDVPAFLLNLCDGYELEHELLRVEITESMMAQNMDLLREMTKRLRDYGFYVLMDDFGSGYSSLNMLKDTNVDVIKLDMKLIDLNAENFERGQRIVESVVAMSHQLGLPVVAEGVETQEQLNMLQALDCIYIQGFKFYKPMPMSDVEVLLNQPGINKYWDLKLDSENRDVRTVHKDYEQNVAALTSRIIHDSLLLIARVNLITEEMEVVKIDPVLPNTGRGNTGNLSEYAGRILDSGIVAPEFVSEYKRRTETGRLRSMMLGGSTRREFTFRTTLGGENEWVTLVYIAEDDVSAQEPWCAFYVQRETYETLPAVALRQDYASDALTGLMNFTKFKSDLLELPKLGYDNIGVVYCDVVGLHEVNNHLGHGKGDEMLKDIANEFQLRFAEGTTYRLGGDEFLALVPDADEEKLSKAAKTASDHLDAIDIQISYGVAIAKGNMSLTAAIDAAEAKMMQQKTDFYASDEKGRQLRILNNELEDILRERQDVWRFIEMVMPQYTGVYVVNMLDDTVRVVRAPEGFLKYATTNEAHFSEAAEKYTEDSILPEYQLLVKSLLDYDTLRRMLWDGQKIKRHYVRRDGKEFDLDVYPYSGNSVDKDYSLWVFTRTK